MLLDYMCADYEQRFNIKLAEMFGLQAAIYLNEIMNIHSKARRKGTLKDGFMPVDRDYITRRTTLTREEQSSAEAKLAHVNVITKDVTNPDRIKYNVEFLDGMLRVDGDDDVSYKVREIVDDMYNTKAATKTKKATEREIKIQKTIRSRMENVTEQDPELRQAYEDWVTSLVYAISGAKFSDVDVRNMQVLLNNKCGDNIPYKIAVLKYITAKKYVTAYNSVFQECYKSLTAKPVVTSYEWA